MLVFLATWSTKDSLCSKVDSETAFGPSSSKQPNATASHLRLYCLHFFLSFFKLGGFCRFNHDPLDTLSPIFDPLAGHRVDTAKRCEIIMDSTLEKRQTFVEDGNGTFLANDGRFDDRRGEFWYSPVSDRSRDERYPLLIRKQKAEIIKWAIIGGIMLFFVIYLVGGYLHAKRRIRKGLKPMRYHKVHALSLE